MISSVIHENFLTHKTMTKNSLPSIRDESNFDMTTIEDYSVDRFYKQINVELPTVCTKCGMQQQLTVNGSDTVWACKECNGKLLQLDDEIVLADKDWDGMHNDDIQHEEAGSGENAFDVLGVKTSEALNRLGLTELMCRHHKGRLVPISLGNKEYAESRVPKMIESIIRERDSMLESNNIWKPTEAVTVFNRKTGTSAPTRFARSFPMSEAGEKNYDQQESLQYVPKLTTAYYITVPWTKEQIEKHDELLRQQEVAKMHIQINKFNALPLKDAEDGTPVEIQYMTTPTNCGNNPPQVAVINKHFVKTGIIKAVDYKDLTYGNASKILKNYFWAKKNGRTDIMNESIRKLRQACNHMPPSESQMGDTVAFGNDVEYVIKEGINGQTSTVVPTKEFHSRHLIDGKIPTFEERMIRRIKSMMNKTSSDWKRKKLQDKIDNIKSGMVTEATPTLISTKHNSKIPEEWITNGMESYKLAIVGSSKGGTNAEKRIRELVSDYQNLYGRRLVIVSGGALGVDSIADRVAKELGVPTEIYLPKTNDWSGYKERNIKIAENSNEVVSIALPKTKIRCYHCNENHEKTAGCYTAILAKEMGRTGRTIVVGLV